MSDVKWYMVFRKFDWYPHIEYKIGPGFCMYHASWVEFKSLLVSTKMSEKVRKHMEEQGYYLDKWRPARKNDRRKTWRKEYKDTLLHVM